MGKVTAWWEIDSRCFFLLVQGKQGPKPGTVLSRLTVILYQEEQVSFFVEEVAAMQGFITM